MVIIGQTKAVCFADRTDPLSDAILPRRSLRDAKAHDNPGAASYR